MNLGNETYIGLDTHRETIHGTALDSKGSIICSMNFKNNKDSLVNFLGGFPSWNTKIALECCGTWRGCYKNLKDLGYENTKLANPLKTSQIAKDKKTDKVDSKILADLLRTGYLPEVYIPSEETLALRDLTRHKANFTKQLTSLKNKIKMTLLREGIKYESKIWNKDGYVWLRSLNNEIVNDFIDTHDYIEKKLKKTHQKIRKLASSKEELILLKSIPGIGDFSATLILAEIGEIKRFPTVKHLHAYSGLVPGVYQSGSKTRMTKMKEVNYWLKGVIIECAGISIRKNNRFQKTYFRLKPKKGWKTARKVTARKLMTVVYHVLRNKEVYHES